MGVFGSYRTVIENMVIRRVWGDCVYVNSHAGEVWAEGVTYRDSTCELTGRHGVGLIAAKSVRVTRVDFDRRLLMQRCKAPDHLEAEWHASDRRPRPNMIPQLRQCTHGVSIEKPDRLASL